MNIRKAELKDAKAIWEAEIEIAKIPGYFCSQPNEINLKAVAKTIKNFEKTKKGLYLVADHNGLIVGHAFLEPLHLKSIRHVSHLAIAVHDGWQDRGIGTLLLKALIEWAKNTHTVEKIELHVRASNARAIALYKKMGFVEEGLLKKRLKVGENHYIDDLLMALTLD